MSGKIDMGKWFSAGWQMFINDIGIMLLFGLIYCLVSQTGIGLVVTGPLIVGFFAILYNRDESGKLDFGNLKIGFDFFLPALLASLVILGFTIIAVIIGMPTIVLAPVLALCVLSLYSFTMLFVYRRNLAFWDAMEASRKLVMSNFSIFIFCLLVTLVYFAGTVLCGVGVIASIPLALCITKAAFDDLVEGSVIEGDVID